MSGSCAVPQLHRAGSKRPTGPKDPRHLQGPDPPREVSEESVQTTPRWTKRSDKIRRIFEGLYKLSSPVPGTQGSRHWSKVTLNSRRENLMLFGKE